jgi:alkaline phosphatase D
MTDNSVQVWVRTVSEVPVRVTVSQSADMADPKVSGPVLSRSRDDYTAVVSVDGLDPDTRYHYTVTVADQVIRGEHQTFRTYPTEDRAARFSIAFGGCAGFVPPREMIWDTIDRFDPLALLQLGDNVYIDDPESPDQQRLMYYQRQSRPEYRRLVAGSPTYAIWDDHDFGMDDSEGGPLVDVPYWKPMVLDIFKQNWVNPAYGFSDHPGVWFDFKIADVHFILLDGRFYREDAGRLTGGERIEGATMLGAHQLAWLLRTLKDSDATFKVLVSPVPWNLKSKGSGVRRLDGWAGYAEEREVIFSTIEENGIEGVVLLSSDRHRSDAWRIERPDGYDFYEFASGQFTNQHTHPEIDGALFSFNGTNSFGLLQFDTQAADPEVRYQIVDREGMPREAITLRHSDLRSPNTPVHHAGHRPPISIGR